MGRGRGRRNALGSDRRYVDRVMIERRARVVRIRYRVGAKYGILRA
ncbi:MAG: hypothetical protein JO362_15585 [Streptomycetaceae bacterium]|nr:hypothetical protein [Streptomycetaceae bacterium]